MATLKNIHPGEILKEEFLILEIPIEENKLLIIIVKMIFRPVE